MSRSLQAFIYKIRLCYPFQRSQHTARGKHAGLRSTEPVELQQSPAVGIEVKLRTGFRSQNRSRTGRGNFAIDRIVHGARLRLRRNDTIHTGRSCQCRNRQCQRVRRHLPQRSETTVVHLLAAALVVQVDYFDALRIVEPGHMRVVKGDMPVLCLLYTSPSPRDA